MDPISINLINFEPSLLQLGEVRETHQKDLVAYFIYDEHSPVLLTLPAMESPFGLSKDEFDRWSISLAFNDGQDTDFLVAKNRLLMIENQIVKLVANNSILLFRRQMDLEAVKAQLKGPLVRTPKKKDYAEYIRARVGDPTKIVVIDQENTKIEPKRHDVMECMVQLQGILIKNGIHIMVRFVKGRVTGHVDAPNELILDDIDFAPIR